MENRDSMNTTPAPEPGTGGGFGSAPLAVRLLAVVFVAFIGLSAVLNLVWGVGPVGTVLAGEGAGFNAATLSAVEEAYNDSLFAHDAYIELHGGLQRAMLKDEVGNFDVVRDEAGNLFIAVQQGSPDFDPDYHLADDAFTAFLPGFQAWCDENGVRFLCVNALSKDIAGYTGFAPGIESHANDNADAFVAAVRACSVEVFDYREQLGRGSPPMEELFYRTDHHWTTQTAFWAYQTFMAYLVETHGFSFPNYAQATDAASYHHQLYANSYLGSVGRRTGSLYSGLEDFTLIWPAFETQFTYTVDGVESTGSFEEVLVNFSLFEQTDLFRMNYYAAYLNGDRPERHIHNPQGQGRVLIVQNSMHTPISAFMATAFEQVTILDYRHYTEMGLAQYLQANPGYDLVICQEQALHTVFAER